MYVRRTLAASLAATTAIGLAACGGGGDNGGGQGGGGGGSGPQQLTIYSSLPLQGSSRVQNLAVVKGAQLALKEQNGQVNGVKITYKSLDDSTAQSGAWDPGQVSKNARQAATDQTTIAYIGEFNSGASAVSIPIINQAGILQVSPANTAVGLTTNGPGADKGEPEKYYPTGKRTYGRVVPPDTVQGAALATVMKEDGCKSIYILNDKSVYGAGLARNVIISAQKQGLQVAGNNGIDPKAPNYRSQAAAIKADCFMFSGTTDQNAVQVYKDVSAALPNAKMYGPDGVAEAAFADPSAGGVPNDIGRKVKVTVATLDPQSYPPAGQRVLKALSENGRPADPYAIYGYEAMAVILDSMKRAGQLTGDIQQDRQKVIDAFFNTKNRKSVLGTYSITKFGDTTLTTYGVYQIKNGQLTFLKSVEAKGAQTPGVPST